MSCSPPFSLARSSKGNHHYPLHITKEYFLLFVKLGFSEDIVYLVAEAIGTEARALNIDSVKRGDYQLCTGMSCLAPFINLVRDPLWGRVQVRKTQDE